jgi:hypothetical protein
MSARYADTSVPRPSIGVMGIIPLRHAEPYPVEDRNRVTIGVLTGFACQIPAGHESFVAADHLIAQQHVVRAILTPGIHQPQRRDRPGVEGPRAG